MFYRVIRPEIFTLLGQAEKITGIEESLQPGQARSPGSCPCPKCSQTLIEIAN
jgi:hypothetical protein